MPQDWEFLLSWLASTTTPPLSATSPNGRGGRCKRPSSQLSLLRTSPFEAHHSAGPPQLSPPATVREDSASLGYRPKTGRQTSLKQYPLHSDTMGTPSPRKRRIVAETSDVGSVSQLSDYTLPRSSSPTKVRAGSPVRELRDIYKFASPPLRYTTSVDDTTPKLVLNLVRNLPLYGVGVIPSGLKVGYSPSEALPSSLMKTDLPLSNRNRRISEVRTPS